jgi:hypothetical protein
MLYFRESNGKILTLWKTFFANATEDNRLYLIFVIHEVIVQSSYKNKKDYIIAFGDILENVFRELIE